MSGVHTTMTPAAVAGEAVRWRAGRPLARVIPRAKGDTRVSTWNKPPTKRPALLAGAAAVAAALALLPLASSHAATTRVTAPTAAPAVRPDVAPPVLTFKMTGKKVTIGGTRQSGALRVVFTVTGEPTGDPTLVRIDPGATVAEFLAHLNAIGNDQNNLYGIGQVVLSTQANKGTSAAYVSLTPGTYIALDPAGNGAPPLTAFTVGKARHPAPLPKPGATIATREFGFTGTAVIRDGELVRWQNNGFLVHMIFGAQASSLADAQKIAADLLAGDDNAAMALAINTYSWDNVLSHGQYFETVVRQPAGFWVIACFMDTQDGREHTTFGMEKVIQIVK
jgi:hypothetical protein